MKINAGTIFGLTLIAAGLLFWLWGLTARGVTPPPGSENAAVAGTSNAWYFVVGAGLALTGLAFAVISQALNKTPPPEIGSTKDEPKDEVTHQLK